MTPPAPLELPDLLADLERRLSALPPDAVPPALPLALTGTHLRVGSTGEATP